jgi:hypothetical protein
MAGVSSPSPVERRRSARVLLQVSWGKKQSSQRSAGRPNLATLWAMSEPSPYSTVTDFARLRGWSASLPMMTAVWYASIWMGIA